MARAPRDETPGSFQHITARGNNKMEIFDDELRPFFLFHLTLVAREFDWLVYAWALMRNHFHVVLQLGDKGLSDGMQRLNTRFARASNAHFGRINHCLGARFFSTTIASDQHLFRSIRYTLWNPARAGVGEHPGDSDWTSYRASAGLSPDREPLASGALLERFGRTPLAARTAFRAFIWTGRERCLEPWQGGKGVLK